MKQYYIANLSKDDIENNPIFPPENTVLISITDNCCQANIINKNQWKDIFRFQFEDVEKEEVMHLLNENKPLPIWARYISIQQAKEIAKILIDNLNKSNIIINCHAGVSRSGAVTEVGLKIGYKLFAFSNLRTINQTVYREIISYIPKKYIFIGKIKKLFSMPRHTFP